MSDWTTAVPIGLIVLFLVGIRLLRSPRSARLGNLLSGAGMLAAVMWTMTRDGLLDDGTAWVAMLVGAAVGLWLAARVVMVQMPQLVALLNGLGGAASALVALTMVSGGGPLPGPAARVGGILAVALGGATFLGSLWAAGKLAGCLPSRPLRLRGQQLLNSLLLLVILAAAAAGWSASPGALVSLGWLAAVLGLAFGTVATLPIGGADMPVMISLLNSASGVAAAVAGFAVQNRLLVGAGAIVGAAGLMLTLTMSRAMNRSLADILSGRGLKTKQPPPEPGDVEPSTTPAPQTTNAETAEPLTRAAAALKEARRLVVVPGYGMALAQAQHALKQLADRLAADDRTLAYAIHPVAGRMPGHMHVLLAEVEVPYDQLLDLDPGNAALAEADVALIVGANDVVNPAAGTAQGTPIYGMPVLDVKQAGCIIVCNKDTAPGYAGVANPLYADPQTVLLTGDACDTLQALTATLDASAPAAAC